MKRLKPAEPDRGFLSAVPFDPQKAESGKVLCPMCSHSVDAQIGGAPRRPHVVRGQRCSRCSASLDAASILRVMPV